MSQLEMESLLHYEDHLATCYEAEYLLELSMRRGLSGEQASSSRWSGYEDSGEVMATASRPFSSSSSLLLLHGGVGEKMEIGVAEAAHPISHPKPQEPLFANSTLPQLSSYQHTLTSSSAPPTQHLSPSVSDISLISRGAPPLNGANHPHPLPHWNCLQRPPVEVCGERDDQEPLTKKPCRQRPEL